MAGATFSPGFLAALEASGGEKDLMQTDVNDRLRLVNRLQSPRAQGSAERRGLSWDPLGDLYSCDCHTQPIYRLLRGGWYPSFGKPHDGLGFAPEMITEYKDSTAIAGIAYYAADHFPEAYRDDVFIGDVVTHNI